MSNGLMMPGKKIINIVQKVSGIDRLARAGVYDNAELRFDATITDSKYKCLILFFGDKGAGAPTLNISNATYWQFEDFYFEGYSGGEKGYTQLGWFYFILPTSFPVHVSAYKTAHNWYSSKNCTLWGIY